MGIRLILTRAISDRGLHVNGQLSANRISRYLIKGSSMQQFTSFLNSNTARFTRLLRRHLLIVIEGVKFRYDKDAN